MSSDYLEELFHLLRLRKYQKRKRHHARDRLEQLQLSCEIRRRLLRKQYTLQHVLAESIRTGRKGDFRLVYDQCRSIRDSCQGILEGHDKSIYNEGSGDSKHYRRGSFLAEITAEGRTASIRFLSDIVSNKDFLIERILSLSQTELDALSAFHRGSAVDRSIFGDHAPPVRRPSCSDPTMDVCRHDPLTLLLGLVGSHRSGTRSIRENQESTWAAVCAKLLQQQRPGSDKFIVALLDIWSFQPSATGKRALESWLMEVLEDGQLLLKRPEKQSFRMRSEAAALPDPGESLRAEAFIAGAIKKLFALLRAHETYGIIPQSATRLGGAIVAELKESPSRMKAAPLFLVTRWLFSSFLVDHIVNPESRGLLLTYHISDIARHRILREIAMRAQKIAFDVSYSWKHAVPVQPDYVADIHTISGFFKPLDWDMTGSIPPSLGYGDAPRPAETPFSVTLYPSDIYTLVQALFPIGRSLSSASDGSGPKSSASSVSGLSIFKESSNESMNANLATSGHAASITSPSEKADNLFLRPSEAARHSPSFGPASLYRIKTDVEGAGPDAQGILLRRACVEISNTTDPAQSDDSYDPFSEPWTTLNISATKSENPYLAAPLYAALPATNPEDGPSIMTSGVHDYASLRDSIFGLLEDRKMSDALFPSSKSNMERELQIESLSARSSNPFAVSSPPRSRGDTNPFRTRTTEGKPSKHLNHKHNTDSVQSPQTEPVAGLHYSTSSSPLVAMLNQAVQKSRADEDFVKASFYAQTLKRVQQLSSSSVTRDGHAPLLRHFLRDAKKSLDQVYAVNETIDLEISRVEMYMKDQDHLLRMTDATLSGLRIKMWYISDVRSAALFEDLQGIVTALRSMGTATRTTTDKHGSAVRHRNTLRPRATGMQLKANAAIFELVAASADRGGAGKLNDDQVTATLAWMQGNGVENICRGEERIHRLCLELAKCINQLVSLDAVQSPVLWASELFNMEKLEIGDENIRQHTPQSSQQRGSPSAMFRPTSRGSVFDSSGHVERFGPMLRHKSYMDFGATDYAPIDRPPEYFENRSPTLTSRSSTTFWSPGSMSPSSVTSYPSRVRSPKVHIRQSSSCDSFRSIVNVKTLVTEIRQSLTSLLISEFGNSAFPTGCETDIAMWLAFDGGYAKRVCSRGSKRGERKQDRCTPNSTSRKSSKNEQESGASSLSSPSTQVSPDMDQTKLDRRDGPRAGHATISPAESFDYAAAYRMLLRKFDIHPDPFVKLKAIHDVQHLLMTSLIDSPAQPLSAESHEDGRASTRTSRANSTNGLLHQDAAARTKIRLDTSSLATHRPRDAAVQEFRTLFQDQEIRPKALFRNLQMIASLVPAEHLDASSQGEAFWNATVAALSLKQDICHMMVETADRIISYHTTNRGHSRTASAAQQERDAASFSPQATSADDLEDVSQYSMADAAQLLLITAKEGDAVAQRELATMYLTHPELLDRVIAPMTRPKDVFKESVMGGGKSKKEQDPARYDPMTMCVAHHWMELSSKGGDVLATKYLQAKDEIERIP